MEAPEQPVSATLYAVPARKQDARYSKPVAAAALPDGGPCGGLLAEISGYKQQELDHLKDPGKVGRGGAAAKAYFKNSNITKLVLYSA